jgi:hypothetical protein
MFVHPNRPELCCEAFLTSRSFDPAPELASRLRWTPRSNLHITLRFFGALLKDEKHVAVANQVHSAEPYFLDQYLKFVVKYDYLSNIRFS